MDANWINNPLMSIYACRTLIQLILLLTYLSSQSSTLSSENQRQTQPTPLDSKPKKRKRSSKAVSGDSGIGISPVQDPLTAVELLLDRLSVWQALSDLNLGVGGFDPPTRSGLGLGGGKGKGVGGETEKEGMIGEMLKSFWDDVLVPL